MRYFTEEENWTQAQVYEAILKNWGSQERCVGQPNFAADSVMSYDIPGRLTTNNQRIAIAVRTQMIFDLIEQRWFVRLRCQRHG